MNSTECIKIISKVIIALVVFNMQLMAMEGISDSIQTKPSVSQVKLHLLKRQVLSQSNTFVDDAKRQKIIAPGCPQKSGDFRLGVFDYEGKFVTGMEGHTNYATDIAAMPGNPDVVVSCGSDSKTISWDLTTGNPLGIGQDEDAMLWKIMGLGKNSQGEMLMVSGGGYAGDKPCLNIWNAQNGYYFAQCTGGHDCPIFSMAKPESQPWFVTGQIDGGIVCVWDFNGKLLARLRVSQLSRMFNALSVYEHPTAGTFIVTGSDQITFWSVANNYKEYAVVQQQQDWITVVAFSDDKTLMVSGDSSGKIVVWKVNAIDDCIEIGHAQWDYEQVNDICIMQDTGIIVSVSGVPFFSQDTTLRVYDSNGLPLNEIGIKSGSNMLTCVRPIGDKSVLAIGDQIGLFSLVKMDVIARKNKAIESAQVHDYF